MIPHPHLSVQLMGDKGKVSEFMYWHPDWVLIRTGSTGSVQWWADSRMSAQLDGPFKTRPEAMAYVTSDEVVK